MDFASLTTAAAKNLRDILEHSFLMKEDENTLVIFDTGAPLAKIISDAYRLAIPTAEFLDFATLTPQDVLARIDALKPRDLVVLVQSANFRLNEFRLRIELFKRELKNIEHVHLGRIPESEYTTYIAALEYDPKYYRTLGHALKEKMDRATRVVVSCDGTELVYDSPLEDTKLNVGDYSAMKNVGGLFPIGEVFTEAKDLRKVNGMAKVFAFAGEDHIIRLYEPFPVQIAEGILTAPDGPPEFQKILDLIKQDEEVLVRELGLGLNPGMGHNQIVSDISAFERQKGVHLSLGAKHAIYAKPGLNRKHGRYHVDIFLDVKRITADEHILFENGVYTNEASIA
jgi:hypothetical protein